MVAKVVLAAAITLAAIAGVQAQELKPAPTWKAVAGLHIGPPATVSITFGVGRVLTREIGYRWGKDSNFTAHSDHDMFLLVEPGLRGGRISLGYGHYTSSASGVRLATLRMSIFKRWRGDSSRVYLGPEASFFAVENSILGLRAGALVRVKGPRGRRGVVPVLDFPFFW